MKRDQAGASASLVGTREEKMQINLDPEIPARTCLCRALAGRNSG